MRSTAGLSFCLWIYRASGFLRRLLPPVLSLATIPTWLAASQDQDDATAYQKKLLENTEQAQFILGSIFKRLRRQLRFLEPVHRKSTWSDYTGTCSHYSDTDAKSKQEFVKGALAEFQPETVLDVGCNTGDFSLLAAQQGAHVVAIDQDAAVVGDVWRRARKEKADILPLVVNLARPTPATGWRNREWPSFLDRARGKFDAVVMLAVLHHIVVNERVPLEDVFDMVAELTTDMLVIEFVAPEDPMFRRIVRGREHLFEALTVESFEMATKKRFEIVRSQRLEHTSRWLYLLRKKG
jgi:2-polyprenyl-3-methyl-5-hydroxy-6-metoxy-1,4-benzoquinol methylase